MKKSLLLLITVLSLYNCAKDDSIEENKQPPTILTIDSSAITDRTIISGGNITSNGDGNIIKKGVCWSTLKTPTIEDSFINKGSGIDNFTVTLEGLDPNTTYYLRAYATNEVGTSYGNEISFTTKEKAVLVFEGDVTLTSQQEVDDFTSLGYTKITGFLYIGALINGPLSDINSLDDLRFLTEIGSLSIFSAHQIENINGLKNLSLIEEDIFIFGNNGLVTIDGFNKLTSIQGDLKINRNNSIVNIDAFKNITNIKGDIDIGNNSKLSHINGLDKLTRVEKNLRITFNQSLNDINGLKSISQINEDLILTANALTNIDGLSSISNIGGSLSFLLNGFLTNLDGLNQLTTIGGNLTISDNDLPANNSTEGLIHIDGLNKLTTIEGNISITLNKHLTNLCGITNAISNNFSGAYEVRGNAYNPTLQDLLDNKCSN